ncbi:MAG: hypothetical protein U1E45_13480 [Geminicoccaceae bacterium]
MAKILYGTLYDGAVALVVSFSGSIVKYAFPESSHWYVFLTMFVGISIFIMSSVVKYSLVSSKWFRRYILRDPYALFMGRWIEAYRKETKENVSSGELFYSIYDINYSYSQDAYSIRGTSYTSNGDPHARFWSNTVTPLARDNPKQIRYQYTAEIPLFRQIGPVHGNAVISFDLDIIDHATGWYWDELDELGVRTHFTSRHLNSLSVTKLCAAANNKSGIIEKKKIGADGTVTRKFISAVHLKRAEVFEDLDFITKSRREAEEGVSETVASDTLTQNSTKST